MSTSRTRRTITNRQEVVAVHAGQIVLLLRVNRVYAPIDATDHVLEGCDVLALLPREMSFSGPLSELRRGSPFPTWH